MLPAKTRTEPVAQPQEFRERRRAVCPEQRRRFDKVAAVSEEIPKTREASQPLHRGEVDELVLQNLVGRLWAVNHLPLGVVTHDRSAAQALENADLNLLRAKR